MVDYEIHELGWSYLSFAGEKWQNLPFLGGTRTLVTVSKVGTDTHRQRQSGTDTHQMVPVPIHQKRVGTGTDQSGTGIDASSSPNFCIRALLSPKFVHQ